MPHAPDRAGVRMAFRPGDDPVGASRSELGFDPGPVEARFVATSAVDAKRQCERYRHTLTGTSRPGSAWHASKVPHELAKVPQEVTACP